MCCALLSLALLGPRVVNALWWLFQPARWELAFRNIFGGPVWWLWPILGIIFLPWATLMYVLVAPGGMTTWDWLWVGIMALIDILSYTGGAGRKRLPGYDGY